MTVFEAAGFTVSEKKTEAILLQTPDQATLIPPRVVQAAGQGRKQKAQIMYLGGIAHENADLSLHIDRRIRLMRACLKQSGPEVYGRTTALLSLKV